MLRLRSGMLWLLLAAALHGAVWSGWRSALCPMRADAGSGCCERPGPSDCCDPGDDGSGDGCGDDADGEVPCCCDAPDEPPAEPPFEGPLPRVACDVALSPVAVLPIGPPTRRAAAPRPPPARAGPLLHVRHCVFLL